MESFWDFSVRTYRTPGVPDACLSLQNDHGADVNMLLYCCWIGATVGVFDSDLFECASEFSKRWAENVVVPLRNARTWMKRTGCDADPVPADPCMALREDIKSVEFAAEKMQQEVLESMVPVDRPVMDTPEHIMKNVVANLRSYTEYMGLDIQDDVSEKLLVIIGAAFPDWNRKDINRRIKP